MGYCLYCGQEITGDELYCTAECLLAHVRERKQAAKGLPADYVDNTRERIQKLQDELVVRQILPKPPQKIDRKPAREKKPVDPLAEKQHIKMKRFGTYKLGNIHLFWAHNKHIATFAEAKRIWWQIVRAIFGEGEAYDIPDDISIPKLDEREHPCVVCGKMIRFKPGKFCSEQCLNKATVEYQHNYYMTRTKEKRKQKREAQNVVLEEVQ